MKQRGAHALPRACGACGEITAPSTSVDVSIYVNCILPRPDVDMLNQNSLGWPQSKAFLTLPNADQVRHLGITAIVPISSHQFRDLCENARLRYTSTPTGTSLLHLTVDLGFFHFSYHAKGSRNSKQPVAQISRDLDQELSATYRRTLLLERHRDDPNTKRTRFRKSRCSLVNSATGLIVVLCQLQ
jgi:hypothetical protein